jgi:hypothetical protein
VKLNDAAAALVQALQPLKAQIPELQISDFYNSDPTPPSLDFYPGDPFQDGTAFGVGEQRVYWTVRARVSVADTQAGTYLLLRLLSTDDPASVEAALANANPPAVVDGEGGVSGFRRYSDDTTEALLGCEWRVGMFV